RYFQSQNIALTDGSQVMTTPGQANDAAQAPAAADYRLDDAYAAEVIRLVNIERANAGLDKLTADQSLCEAAKIRASEIRSNFSHTRPDGSSCFTALSEVSASYTSAGENIAIGQGSPEEVVKAWMNSPGHRANILDSSFGRIGVASLANNGGNYGGYAWAQFFAN
ncbi:MAG: transporter, partial [Clostridia bacterium]|nr:transporter [Clostridia bacterium]